MRDGIIQKVFNPVINQYKNDVDMVIYKPQDFAQELELLKKELIEEIKKLEKENNKDDLYNFIFTTDLIGDNE